MEVDNRINEIESDIYNESELKLFKISMSKSLERINNKLYDLHMRELRIEREKEEKQRKMLEIKENMERVNALNSYRIEMFDNMISLQNTDFINSILVLTNTSRHCRAFDLT